MGQDRTAERLSELIDRIDDVAAELRVAQRTAQKAWKLYNDGEGQADDVAKVTSELSSVIVELGTIQVEATNVSASAVLDEMAEPVVAGAAVFDGEAVVLPVIGAAPRFTLRPARGGGWLIFDEETGDNAALRGAHNVRLTYADRDEAAQAARELEAAR